jgi:hypothetical protein
MTTTLILSGQDAVQSVPPRDQAEPAGPERVQADRDPPEPRPLELPRHFGEVKSVRGQG